jgi:5'-nucleotidase / UDP-sugar diphosphatase
MFVNDSSMQPLQPYKPIPIPSSPVPIDLAGKAGETGMKTDDQLTLAGGIEALKSGLPMETEVKSHGKNEKENSDVRAASTSPGSGDEPASKKPAPESPVTLTILYENDLHGYVEEHAPEGDEKIVGGFARTAAKIKEERAKDADGTLTLDGGDFFDGGYFARFSDGEIVSKAFRETGFDATVVGNHDMNWGRQAYKDMLDGMNTTVLADNILDKTRDGTLSDVKPYTIVERNGLKIGIIGTTSTMTGISGPDKETIQVEDPAVKTKQYVDELKNGGKVDMVIVLSHLGEEDDKKLAASVQGIDVIVGSHSHSAIKTPEKAGDTLIVQAGGEGDYLGKLQVSYDPKSHKITESRGELIPITADITPDPAVERIMAPYMEELKPLAGKVLGHVSQDLKMFDRDLKSTNLTHLFVDAQKKDSDVAVSSMFSIRCGIDKGPITAYDLFNTYPFENELLQVQTKGASVLKYLESSLRDTSKGMYTLFSGITIKFDPDRPEKDRITSVNYQGKELSRKEFEQTPLKVSMDNYTHGKGFFKESPVIKQYGRVFDILQEHFTSPGALDNISDAPRYESVK